MRNPLRRRYLCTVTFQNNDYAVVNGRGNPVPSRWWPVFTTKEFWFPGSASVWGYGLCRSAPKGTSRHYRVSRLP